MGGASGALLAHPVRGVVHGAPAGVVWCAPLSLPVHSLSLDVSRLVGSAATPLDVRWPVVSLGPSV
ncbi:hypothetical protein [Nocardia gipuzkoensis]|uniref:hypothetical protein n=1 Tax=Nocardia gipuzkoensis TaxID=2749991 RepID=UPI003EE0E78D